MTALQVTKKTFPWIAACSAVTLSTLSISVTSSSATPCFVRGFQLSRRLAAKSKRQLPPPQQLNYRPFSQLAASTMDPEPFATLRFVDIGANLLDERFTQGVYHDKKRHEPDFHEVVKRAEIVGVKHIIMTAGTIEESAKAVEYVRKLRRAELSTSSTNVHFSCTVGVHPTRCQQEFVDSETPDEDLLQRLLQIAQDGMTDGSVVAVGEFGLDYDRLGFCPKDVQHKYFVKQLQVLAANTGLPLFLNNRSVGSDLYDLLKEHRECWKKGGVVHSFDDTHELAMKFIDDLGLYIGLNGCSLRTEENLQVVKQLPLENILLETDCPYCEVKRTHPGHQFVKTQFQTKQEKKFEMGVMVKGRHEPCQIIQVAEVIAGVKGVPLQTVSDTCFQSSLSLYGWDK